jgi:hypothetical protein
MNPFLPVLAESLPQTLRHSPLLLGCGVLAVLFLLGLIRVLFFARRRHPYHHRRPLQSLAKEDPSVPNRGGSFRALTRAGRRRRRRQRAALNPTLAETRGLPPVRSEASPPPPP